MSSFDALELCYEPGSTKTSTKNMQSVVDLYIVVCYNSYIKLVKQLNKIREQIMRIQLFKNLKKQNAYEIELTVKSKGREATRRFDLTVSSVMKQGVSEPYYMIHKDNEILNEQLGELMPIIDTELNKIFKRLPASIDA